VGAAVLVSIVVYSHLFGDRGVGLEGGGVPLIHINKAWFRAFNSPEFHVRQESTMKELAVERVML